MRLRSITLFLQQGCQATVGQAQVTLNNNGQTSLSGTAATAGADTITPTVAGSPIPEYQQTLTPGTIAGKALVTASWPSKAPADDTPDKATKPDWVKPGWKDDTLTVRVDNTDLHLDSCAGPVSLRFIGSATMSTKRSNYTTAAFSDIVQV